MMAGVHPRLIDIFFFVTLLIASDDIALRVSVGDIQIRLSQILQGLVTIVGLVLLFLRGRVTVAIGLHFLAAWCILNWVSSFSSSNSAFVYAYAAWLSIFIVYIFGMVQLYAAVPIEYVYLLCRMYLVSYVCLAAFGIAQFVLGIVGIDVLVTQWWLPHLPRVNAMSYEPSYYATYLIIGWGMALSWLRSGSAMFSNLTLAWLFIILTTAILISGSRMGIVCCVAYLLILLAIDAWHGLLMGKMRLSTVVYVAVASLVVVFMLALLTGVIRVHLHNALFLLEGTGLFDTAAHSAERSEKARQTISLWWDNPIFGSGLGGVWVRMSAGTSERPTVTTGMNIFAEILAGTGVVGFCLFLIYLIVLLGACFLSSDKTDNELKRCLRALGIGLILEMAILQFNQNILRVYVWNHFAIISIVVAAVRRTT